MADRYLNHSLPVAAPLAAPVTLALWRSFTARYGHLWLLREATIWDLPHTPSTTYLRV